MRAWLGTALAGAMMLGAVPAGATTTITFDEQSNGVYFTPAVTSAGFVATENLNEDYGTPMGTNRSIDGKGPSNGTVHLDSWTNDGSHSIWTLTQANGRAFSLASFDFAGSSYGPNYASVSQLTLTGRTSTNGVVNQTFSPSGSSFQTFIANSSFGDLTSVQFDAFGLKNRAAYDNIVVGDARPTGGAPEPATWAMMIIGFGAAGTQLRRQRRAATGLAAA